MAKAIAKQDAGGLPAYLKDVTADQVRDDSNFDSSDVVIPMIKLLQGTSPEVEDHDDAKPGIFWHTGLDIPLGSTVDFIVGFRKKRYLLVAPMEDGQGVLARADDFDTWDREGSWEVKFKDRKEPVLWEIRDKDVVTSGLDQWGTSIPDDENSPPAATLFYDYIVLLPGIEGASPVSFPLTRSKIKKARKGLNDKIALQQNNGRPMQACVFQAKAVKETTADNQGFYNLQFSMNGFAEETDFIAANQIHETFKNMDYRVKGEEKADNDERAAPKADSDKF